MREFSEWHKFRFKNGTAALPQNSDENIAAAHKLLSKIINLENTDYAFLLLKSIYYFLFFSYPDKYGRPLVKFSDLRKNDGKSFAVKNPYPVFLKAEDLGIKTSLVNSRGVSVRKLSEACGVVLSFADRRVLNGFILFEKGAEENLGVSGRRLYEKTFRYFISADFSFLSEDKPLIKEHYLSGYGENIREYAEKINGLFSGFSDKTDIKTDFLRMFSVKRSVFKKDKKSFLFSVEFGERRDFFTFTARLYKNDIFGFGKIVNRLSSAFVQRFFHDGDCRCIDCGFADFKVSYDRKQYSVPFRQTVLSFPVRTEDDFNDASEIIKLILNGISPEILNDISSER